MTSRHRPKPSFTNVVVAVCLFVVLGGSSFAAPARNAVKTLITGKDIKDGSVTTKDVRDASLLADDFKSGQLPRGAPGASGVNGAAGAAGAPGGTGAPGAPGQDGHDGAPGTAGPTGPTGAPGAPGQDGQGGSPDTPAEILAKLAEVDGADSGLDADSLDGVDAKAFARLGGVINSDGTVSQGTGFTVTHPSDGEYQVSFPTGTLSNAACPPIVVAIPFSGIVRNPQLSGRGCSGLGAGNFTIKMLDNNGVAHDAPFLFIAM
jgi:hypothetical protein